MQSIRDRAKAGAEPLETYIVVLLGFGMLVLLTAWLPMVLAEAPLSLPIVCVAIGAGLFALPWMSVEVPHPQQHLAIIERVSEMVVIISLMGAGLKIDRRIGWRSWRLTWRLLGIAMPLTILALAALAHLLLDVGAAAALLLAAVLAPTDPVLASDIQVGPPNSGDDDDTRFALTSEAGLNDALAFPFVHAAIALSVLSVSGEPWFGHWLAVDVVWKLGAGLVIGVLAGQGLGYLIFRLPNRAKLSRTGDGLVALGVTCCTYGAAELAQGYGFLAVFVAALVLRARERDHDYHSRLHDFADEFERLLTMCLLVGFGAVLASGKLFAALSWQAVVYGLIALFLVRPAAGWVSLAGTRAAVEKRAVISFYGIRGIGSVYYLAYALGHGRFAEGELLWSCIAFIILVSIPLHGATASPVMAYLDRRQV